MLVWQRRGVVKSYFGYAQKGGPFSKRGFPMCLSNLHLALITSTTALSLSLASSIIIISNNCQELFDFGSQLLICTLHKALGIDLQQKDQVDRIQEYCSLMIRISWIVKSRTLWRKKQQNFWANLLHGSTTPWSTVGISASTHLPPRPIPGREKEEREIYLFAYLKENFQNSKREKLEDINQSRHSWWSVATRTKLTEAAACN